MAIGTDRYASRADTLLFIGCVALSLAALSLPDQWRNPLAQGLRQTVLAPFLILQRQTELLAAARSRYDGVVAQRDSSALAATFLPELRSENTRLRGLLGLSSRLGGGYVSAEILHQPEPTNPLSFVVSAGRREGVRPLSAVVSPEGLVGLVATVDEHTSVVLSWAHPEFRASAIAVDGSVVGIAAPHGADGPGGHRDRDLRAGWGVSARHSHRYRGRPSRRGKGVGTHLPRAPRRTSVRAVSRHDSHIPAPCRGRPPGRLYCARQRERAPPPMRRTDRYRYPVIMSLLVVLQFTVRSRLGGDRVAPDFLLLALLIYTIRAEPGRSAAGGFVVGLLRDALTPASFGAGALAHTLVGVFSSWAKAVFFAEHVFVKGCLFFAGTWLRNLIVLLASGRMQGSQLAWELLVWSPLQGLTTALVGIGVLWFFRGWVSPRRSVA